MNWQVIVGVLGVLLAAAFGVWYKYKAQAAADQALTLSQQATAQADKAKKLADDQLLAKAEMERKDLNEQTKRVLAIQDAAERKSAALALLFKFRGIH